MKFILNAGRPTVASNISKHDPPNGDGRTSLEGSQNQHRPGNPPTGAVYEIGNCIELRNILKQPLLQCPNLLNSSIAVPLLLTRGATLFVHGILHLF
jgi:hypothetical protein